VPRFGAGARAGLDAFAAGSAPRSRLLGSSELSDGSAG
jgi:hypothetical protein